MATTWVSTTYLGLKGEATLDYARGTYVEEHEYQVVFSDANATGADVTEASGVPTYATQLVLADGTNTGFYNTGLKITQNTQDRRVFSVLAAFAAGAVNSQTPPPTVVGKWNVIWSSTQVPLEETLTSDLSTPPKPIVNSAGEPFDPPLNRMIYDEQITVSFYTTAVDWANIDACKGHINSGDVVKTIGGASRTMKDSTMRFDNASVQEIYDNTGTKIASVSYIFTRRSFIDDGIEIGWLKRLDDIGVNQLDSDGKLVPILDGFMRVKFTPSYLDGSGHPLAPGATVIKDDFNIYNSTSFDSLLTGT